MSCMRNTCNNHTYNFLVPHNHATHQSHVIPWKPEEEGAEGDGHDKGAAPEYAHHTFLVHIHPEP